MKLIAAIFLLLFAISQYFAQTEQSPMVEKDINYKDWTYKNVRDGQESNLRDLSNGKKLVIVVYFAPWCLNWRYDAPFLQRFYNTYKDKGLEIIGVGEYDPVDSMKRNLEDLKVTFPVVYESADRADREKTKHNEYRKAAGDSRKWGTTWYILLDPAAFEKKGDTLVKRANVINGEMFEVEGEKYIREKLGLPPVDSKGATAKNGVAEACDPSKPGTKNSGLKKP